MKKDKVPIIVPSLDQRYACLKFDSIQKIKMKKKKTPSWFYGSNGVQYKSNPVLPGIGPSSHDRADPIREDLERLERIQDWLRQSYRSPVGIIESYKTAQNHSHNDNKLIDMVKETGFYNTNEPVKKKTKSPKCSSVPSKINRNYDSDDGFEDDITKGSHINSEPALPKLQMYTNLTGEPEIVGTSLQSHYKPVSDPKYAKFKTDSGSIKSTILKSSEYQTPTLPSEMSADEYIKRRSRTYYGLDRSFSDYNSSQQMLRKEVGPIQRPHVVSPMGDVLIRQRTRFGDTMMHAKSPSKAFTDQKGRTYTLHAKLKDMLLKP